MMTLTTLSNTTLSTLAAFALLGTACSFNSTGQGTETSATDSDGGETDDDDGGTTDEPTASSGEMPGDETDTDNPMTGGSDGSGGSSGEMTDDGEEPDCGDNVINNDEDCDGIALGGATCGAEKGYVGEPTCNEYCELDYTDCLCEAFVKCEDVLGQEEGMDGYLPCNDQPDGDLNWNQYPSVLVELGGLASCVGTPLGDNPAEVIQNVTDTAELEYAPGEGDDLVASCEGENTTLVEGLAPVHMHMNANPGADPTQINAGQLQEVGTAQGCGPTSSYPLGALQAYVEKDGAPVGGVDIMLTTYMNEPVTTDDQGYATLENPSFTSAFDGLEIQMEAIEAGDYTIVVVDFDDNGHWFGEPIQVSVN